MARRTLNHKALRADYDAAERRKAEAAEGAGSDAATEAAPTKKKTTTKPARSKRTAKSMRQRVVWGVFNNSNARVQTFPFPRKQEAEDYAAKMRAEKGSTYFVQPVKEPIDEANE